MINTRLFNVLIVLFIFMLAVPALEAASEQDAVRRIITETVGKQDPFEVLRPMTPIKQVTPQNPVASPEQIPTEPVVIETPELFVRAVMLKFLRAENLERVITNMTSQYGSVSTDATTNTLIICDTEEKVDKIVSEIRKVDQTPKQILIEVVIVDVQLSDDTEIGVDWNHIFGDDVINDYGTVFGDASTPDYSGNLFKRSLNQTLSTTLIDAGTGGAFGLIQDGLMITIRALQQTKNVEILATPKVLVLSGQEATIKTVEEVPYTERSETSEGGSLTSTVFKEVGITLTVKALLNDDGRIMLDVQPEQSVQTGSLNGVPVVDSRQARTSLLMNNHQIVVIGGLRRKETTLSQNKVPLLGDLPLVGGLFSNDQTVVMNSELLVMLSPHIYDDGEISNYEMEKFNELKVRDPLRLDKKASSSPQIIKQRPLESVIIELAPSVNEHLRN